eukprot:GHVU01117045.1.p1 GENE.GHVU01117045.1~~GHVU01117045.1.p1  ORF type:complete len:322 (+),score=30.50 GHVU01117045.1:282-1247(+)
MVVVDPMIVSPADVVEGFCVGCEKKIKRVWWIQGLAGFMGGFWVGLAGHVATIMGGSVGAYFQYVVDPTGTDAKAHAAASGMQLLMYMLFFPFGLVIIVLTASDLFTAGVMYFFISTVRGRVPWYHLFIHWTATTILNCLGAVFAAFILSYCGGGFSDLTKEYLFSLCAKKVTKLQYHEIFFRGIGCNIVVCITVFVYNACRDSAGKLIALWMGVMCFGLGGFEHIVANMYTIPTGLMMGWGGGKEVGEMFYKNWLMTWLGNVVGGLLFVGVVQWAATKPELDERDQKKQEDKVRNLSQDVEMGIPQKVVEPTRDTSDDTQ